MKTLFTIAAILFSFNVYSQTLSFAEIVHLHSRKDAEKFLVSKSFTSPHAGDHVEKNSKFVINSGTDNEEQIEITKLKSEAYVSYMTLNPAYIESLLKQIKAKYHKVSAFDEPNFKFYQFGNPDFLITVNLEKGKRFHSVVIKWE
jgi:hypothetical protein